MTETTRFFAFLFFFCSCASRRTLRKLRHYLPKFAQPVLPIVTPRASAFSSMFKSQKSELSRRVPFLFLSLSRFILSTRTGPELFCLLAYLNGAPALLKRPCLNPSSGDANADRGKTRGSRAQFYGKPNRGLLRRRKEPREKELEDEREKGVREWKMTYLMIFAAVKKKGVRKK